MTKEKQVLTKAEIKDIFVKYVTPFRNGEDVDFTELNRLQSTSTKYYNAIRELVYQSCTSCLGTLKGIKKMRDFDSSVTAGYFVSATAEQA